MMFTVPGVKYDIRTRAKIPQTLLKRGFLCLQIRTSCFIISTLSLITSLISVSGLLATVSRNNPNEVEEGSFTRIVALLFCAVGLDIFTSTLLFFGLLTGRKHLVVPYAFLNSIMILMAFVTMGIGIYKPTTTWKDAAISVAVQGFSIHVWMIVVSYYQLMGSSYILAEKMVE